MTPLRSATPAPDDKDYTGLEPDAAEPEQAVPAPADHIADPAGFSVGSNDAPADDVYSADTDPADADVGSDPVRNLDTAEPDQASSASADHIADPVGFLVGSDDAPADDASSADADPADADVGSYLVRNLDTAEPDQASPAPADHLADPVGFLVGSDDAPADDASSTDSDVGSDQVYDVDTTEVEQSAKECKDIRIAVAESEQRVAPLRIGFDALARRFAQRGRELDQLKTKRALSYQELHRLRSSHADHIEELALLLAERDILARDRQAQLNHLVNFVMGLPPSVGIAYDKWRREQSAAYPVPPPNNRARVTVTSIRLLGPHLPWYRP
uniref:Uncharacterized protein n=1 Tax=Peronospora matthiolae TaxID=2874970 RepID=A0AAV1TVE6_9STRA